MHEFRRLVILVCLVPFAVLPLVVARPACRVIAAFLMRCQSPYAGTLATKLPMPLASRVGRSRRAALRRMESLELYDRVLVLRAALLPRWRRRTTLEGIEHLERALTAGRGAILWVQPCVSSNVAVKQALYDVGYPLVHLTRPGHGFSSSPLGVRIVSPILRRAEDRFLGERVVIDTAHSVGPLRQLRRRLAENRVVSITVTTGASRVDILPFLNGYLRLPRGPIELAASSGAALLPLFTAGDPAHPGVRIGAPLPVGKPGADAVNSCEETAARWLEEQVLQHPECWTGWRQGLFQLE